MQFSTRLAVFAALILFAAVLIYSQGLSGPLLFDDKAAISGNNLAKIDGATFDDWRVAAFSSNSGPLRRPIAMLSFAANHAVAGQFTPFGLKAVNLAIHVVIAVLLYFFSHAVLAALALTPDVQTRRLVAITAAAIWLLHPLQVSTVLYAVQRMAQLSTLFVVAGLLVFMRYRQRWAERGAATGDVLAAGLWLLLLTALAALSKENGILLPWLVMVLEVCIFRGRWAGTANRQLEILGWLLFCLPLVVVSGILLLDPGFLIGGYGRREFTLDERLLTQARMLWRYLGWIVLPNISDMGFQHDDIPLSKSLWEPWTTVVAVFAWPLALAAAFTLRRRYPLFLLALLFYLVGHGMESSIIALEMVYEHRNYLPGVLVCLALAALVVLPAVGSGKVSYWYPVMGILAVLAVLLLVRVLTWSDELTLSRVNVESHPDSSRSNYFYANALLRRYKQRQELGLSEAEVGELLLVSRHYFERMYQSNPRDVAALVMLFYMDNQFFPELQQQVDWLEKLENLLAILTLQASDWNALATLVDCFASRSCQADRDRVTRLIDRLGERYPRSSTVMQYRYAYLSSLDETAPDLLPQLKVAHQLSPRSLWIYYALLAEYARREDPAAMYETAGQWLAHDRHRFRLPLIKAQFAGAPGSQDAPDD